MGARGYLGVDAFFVLSGFLITRLLLAEWHSSRAIDLPGFWRRRVRRLLPAFFLVLGAVALFAATWAPVDMLDRLRGDALATLGYVANWRFVTSSESYFAQFTSPSPLQHVWSFAIEEQVLPVVAARVPLTPASHPGLVPCIARDHNGTGRPLGAPHVRVVHAGGRPVARVLRHGHPGAVAPDRSGSSCSSKGEV